MPTYDFKCKKCDREEHDVLLRITHTADDKPVCCGEPMDYWITSVPLVHWVDPVIEPFKHIAVKSDEVITTTRQNREFMKRNDLVDANDIKPPTEEENSKILSEINGTIEKITPTAEQSARMSEQGLDSIID